MNPSPDRGPIAPVERPLVFSTTGQWLLLLFIALLACGLRMYHLGSWSIWVDEAHTWRDITTPLSVFWEREGASNYPVSYLLGRGAIDWFGAHDPSVLRLPCSM